MELLRKETLIRVRNEIGGANWSDAELDELVQPKMGIISGLASVLADLDELRRVDLGSLPPAAGIERNAE